MVRDDRRDADVVVDGDDRRLWRERGRVDDPPRRSEGCERDDEVRAGDRHVGVGGHVDVAERGP